MGSGDNVSRDAADHDEGARGDGSEGMRTEAGGTPTVAGAGAAADVRQVLHRHGYTVGIERRGWVECVVLCAGETWRGAGVDESAALASALAAMLPSGLARALFDRATREASASTELSPSGRIDARPSGAGVHLSPRAGTEPDFGHGELGGASAPESASSIATGDGANLCATAPDIDPSPHPCSAGEAQGEVRGVLDSLSACAADPVARPSVCHGAGAPFVDIEPGRAGARSGPAGATREEIGRALAELDRVDTEIDGAIDLGLLAPRLLRCQISAWIARARHWQDSVPERPVEIKVAGIAHRLEGFSKGYWPGSVPLLKLGTSPADARSLFPTEGSDWLEVAEDAERALLERLPNEDEYGWRDADVLEPQHPAPAALLGDVEVKLEAIEAMLRGSRRHADLQGKVKDQVDRDLPKLAFQLRWLRGAIPDPAQWGRAMGRLRRLAESVLDLPKKHELRVALDPATRPEHGGWAVKLGFDVGAHDRARLLPEVRAALPAEGAPSEAWSGWFENAVAKVHGDELFKVVVQNRAARIVLAGLNPQLLGERNVRRQLKNLQKRLAAAAAGPATGAPGVSVPENPKDVPGDSATWAPTGPSPVEQAHALIAGWPALVVSNRNDPTNRDALHSKLGLDVHWLSIEGSGRIDDACARIRQGNYRIVLAATAFIGHSEEGRCRDACRAAEIPFVRAERCRPVGAAIHILQALGYASPAPVVRHATAGG